MAVALADSSQPASFGAREATSGPAARRPAAGPAPQPPFAVAIFLSAFLLFQVQLLLGKKILPMFGGAPAVWTACLLVYQVLLLAGYAYAHGLAARISLRRQALAQIGLLSLSGVALIALSRLWPTPITPGANWRPAADANPTWTIVWYLLASIGLPFFLLSTTSPLLQHWYAQALPGRSPYRLYALSNAGSLLGLLSYPFLAEPYWGLRTQAWVWTASYLLAALAYAGCAARVLTVRPAAPASPESLGAGARAGITPRSMPVLWMSYAACASVLLLATTNFICQEVAVIPFLWVVPLCLYLLSFILCFESDRWYRREVFHALFAVTAGLVMLVTLPGAEYSYLWQLVFCCALLFAGCMVCHGEAARTRPPAQDLTRFYLSLAAGGALGGICVSLLAPQAFPGYWEFPLGILGCAALLLLSVRRDPGSWWHTGQSWAAIALLAGILSLTPSILSAVWPPAARIPAGIRWAVCVSLGCISFGLWVRQRRPSDTSFRPAWVRLSARLALTLLTAGLTIPQKADFFHVIGRSRNFYGVLSVVDVQPENYLALRHGKTVHGFQFRDPNLSRIPTGYYGPHGGANILLRHWPQHPMRVGLVGIGAGTLAALAQPGDVYRFYEINPDVLRWSSGKDAYFTYLRDSPGQIQIVLGDARLSLEREASRGERQQFDVLVLDAFSSDAIPMHLLTREAFAVYEQHLRGPDSVIAVHISNRTLDLGPVVAGLAKEFHYSFLRTHPTWMSGFSAQSDWILLSKDAASLSAPELKQASIVPEKGERSVLWTDDYSNLLGALRWKAP